MEDADLVLAARGGDRDALAAIYDRYADRLHDFCHSVLRDRAEAADAMQDTFVLAAQRLEQLRDPAKLRPWLYAIARNESLRRARARGRAVPTEDAGADTPADTPSPEDGVSADEAREIVWAAAAGLSERDRALLDLHLRQGLDGQELAAAIGVTPNHAYVLMNRLRGQVERSLGALLVARKGRDDCPELREALSGWDGRFSPLWRKRVARHVDGCALCSEQRGKLVSPLAALAAVPAVPAPVVLRDRVLERVELVRATRAATSGSAASEPVLHQHWPRRMRGYPPSMFPARAGRRALAAAALLALAASSVTTGILLWQHDDRGTDAARAAAAQGPTTSTAARSASSTTRPPATTTSAPVAPSTTAPSPATSTTNATVDPAVDPDPDPGPGPDPGPPPGPAPPPPAPPPDASAPIVQLDVKYACIVFGSDTNVLSADVTDPSGVAWVRVTVSGSGPSGAMSSGDGERWSIVAGAYTNWTLDSGTHTWTVTAADRAGNQTTVSGPSFEVLTIC